MSPYRVIQGVQKVSLNKKLSGVISVYRTFEEAKNFIRNTSREKIERYILAKFSLQELKIPYDYTFDDVTIIHTMDPRLRFHEPDFFRKVDSILTIEDLYTDPNYKI